MSHPYILIQLIVPLSMVVESPSWWYSIRHINYQVHVNLEMTWVASQFSHLKSVSIFKYPLDNNKNRPYQRVESFLVRNSSWNKIQPDFLMLSFGARLQSWSSLDSYRKMKISLLFGLWSLTSDQLDVAAFALPKFCFSWYLWSPIQTSNAAFVLILAGGKGWF